VSHRSTLPIGGELKIRDEMTVSERIVADSIDPQDRLSQAFKHLELRFLGKMSLGTWTVMGMVRILLVKENHAPQDLLKVPKSGS
jgi:hypothetical protein